MPTPAERWETIRDNLLRELAQETDRRADLTDAGHPPPTTYSFAGRNYDWNGYLHAMMQAIKDAELALAASQPYEEIERGWVGG